ncbi:sigma-54-dependent transcriptional regulator [Halalkalibacter hemicellulosilyticus]|uniref:Sigma-L-dependent transcriptional regulator n=1 Tax=Halalkalibacter hemicellulosilyticusJCM 9152 TaxID=1236971 RepID=W4QI69_9BACI|nr:sigma-54-dependent transcriptional regulator [Halalkalibacter hemicellulosilyticus]GAE31825.1 sigma-L-dependent transcriptional regulator [Halalkalibacter hemicellulosilyticusJCM 9152]
MKTKVLLIAPYKGLAELIQSMQQQLSDFTIKSHIADLDQSKSLLDDYAKAGEDFDVIISRGGTANLLRKNTNIPVIDISISGYDILRILTLLKSYNVKIGMVGFENVIHSFKAVSSVIQIDVEYRVVQKEADVMDTLKELQKLGIYIIVGDAVTIRLATSLGLQGVLITSGKESVEEAFQKARTLKSEIKKHSSQAEVYHHLLNQLTNPVALIKLNGQLHFANTALKRQLDSHIKKLNFFTIYHPSSIVFEDDFQGVPVHFFIEDNQFKPPYLMNIGRVSDSDLTPYHYVELSRYHSNGDAEVDIIFSDPNMESVPQLISIDPMYTTALEEIINRGTRSPFTILGERGTGKRMFLKILLDKAAESFETITEIRFHQPQTSTFNRVIKLLKTFQERNIVHFCNIEKLSKNQQKRLSEAIAGASFQTVFSFVGDRDLLEKEQSGLDTQLAEQVRNQLFYFLPLRKRTERLAHFVRTFILYFNEQYGKQVIGVDDKAMERLENHPWYENMVELRLAIKQLVKQTNDVYIHDVEHTLKTIQKERAYGNQSFFPVNIHQPMEKIEKDIISEVYLQENNNQSKAAKRLGLNRSTLWRKMNS